MTTPMTRAAEDYLLSIISRGVVTPASTVDVSAIKQVIQQIAWRVARGLLDPCPSCQTDDGVPTGIECYTDADGIRDTRDCVTCHGWTVVTGAKR